MRETFSAQDFIKKKRFYLQCSIFQSSELIPLKMTMPKPTLGKINESINQLSINQSSINRSAE